MSVSDGVVCRPVLYYYFGSFSRTWYVHSHCHKFHSIPILFPGVGFDNTRLECGVALQGEHATSRQTTGRAGKRKGPGVSHYHDVLFPFERERPRLDRFACMICIVLWRLFLSLSLSLGFLVQVGLGGPFQQLELACKSFAEMKNSLFGYGIGLQLSASKKGALFRNTSSSILQHPNYIW
jgi:hypothetical protein